jgi:hypothetical protein
MRGTRLVSIPDPTDRVAIGASWRCDGCGTVQPEAPRCRTCGRASVSCASCRRFSWSVVPGIGYCADDSARTPMDGRSTRWCWQQRLAPWPEGGLFGGPDPVPSAAATTCAGPSASDAAGQEPGSRGSERSGSTDVVIEPRSPALGLVEAPPVDPGRRLCELYDLPSGELASRTSRGSSRGGSSSPSDPARLGES